MNYAKVIGPSANSDEIKSLLIYGSPKIGKTTLAASFPRSLIISLDPGGTDYVEHPAVISSSDAAEIKWDDKTLLQMVLPAYDFVIIDSITMLERFIADSIVKDWNDKHGKGAGSIGELGQSGAGYARLQNAIKNVYIGLRNACKHIIFIGHQNEKTLESFSGNIFEEKELLMTGTNKKIFLSIVDAIGFAYRAPVKAPTDKPGMIISFDSGDRSSAKGSRLRSLAGRNIFLPFDPSTNKYGGLHEIFPSLNKPRQQTQAQQVQAQTQP